MMCAGFHIACFQLRMGGISHTYDLETLITSYSKLKVFIYSPKKVGTHISSAFIPMKFTTKIHGDEVFDENL